MIQDLIEWDLSILHAKALKCQDFEQCAEIQNEVDDSIQNDTLRHSFMQAYRYFNPLTEQFEGPYKVDELNGLFDKYIEKYPPI